MFNSFFSRMQDGKQGNQIESLIKKKAPLEDFYKQEDFISYLNEDQKSQDIFLDYLVKQNMITLIIDYCLFPKKIQNLNQKDPYFDLCQYAYMSLLVFEIYKQRIVQHNTNKYLGYIFSYLDQQPSEMQSTASSYFETVLSAIFTKENVLSWMLLESNHHQLEKFVNHISVPAISTLVRDSLCSNQETQQKNKLIAMLMKRFDEESEPDSEILENISNIFTFLFQLIEDEGEYHLQKYAIVIYDKKNLDIFFKKIFTSNDSFNISYTSEIIIEIMKNVQAGELGPYLTNQVENLLKVLSYEDQSKSFQQEIPTSYGTKIKHFGHGRMKVLEIFQWFMLQYEIDEGLMSKIAKTNFFQIAFNLFFQYAWNSKLSSLVETIIVQAIKMNNNHINTALIYNVDIVNEIVTNYRKSNIFIKYGKNSKEFKKGFVGSLTKIARSLEEMSNPFIKSKLKENEKWITFKKNKLSDLTKREEMEWCTKIENLGSLAKVEHMWQSYQDNSIPKSGARGVKSLGLNPSQGDVMQRSAKRSKKLKENDELSNLQPHKIQNTQVMITDPNNVKELFIHTALHGCGTQDCVNPFCKSNPVFAEKHKFLSEFDVTTLTNPQNLLKYKVCKAINQQLSNKLGKSKLVFDVINQTFGSLVNISIKYDIYSQQYSYLTSSEGGSKSFVKGVSAASKYLSSSELQDKWSLEIVENDWVQIRNQKDRNLLRSGDSFTSQNKQYIHTGVGNPETDLKEKQIQFNQNRANKDLAAKWQLTNVGGNNYTIQNLSSKAYLTIILNKNNKPDQNQEIALTTDKQQTELNIWKIEYI